MHKILRIANSPMRHYDFHPEIYDMLSHYAKSSISHTVIYGPGGCGKFTMAKQLIAMHMQTPLQVVYRTQLHSHSEKEKCYFFAKSTVHFELDVRNFASTQQHAMISILLELSKTVNVALNRYNIILLRNAELISRNIQQQLRMMMENMYATTRMIFVSSNIDRIDDTLLSRMVCVRVPSPSLKDTADFIKTRALVESTAVSNSAIKQCIHENSNNITLTILKLNLKSQTADNEVMYLSKAVYKLLKQCNPIPPLREIIQRTNLIHTPWNQIINAMMTACVLPRIERNPQAMEAAIRAWNSFSYQYSQESRKECAIEECICKLSLLLKHKEERRHEESILHFMV